MNHAEALKQIHEILEENFWDIELVPILGDNIRKLKSEYSGKYYEDWEDYTPRINSIIACELNMWFYRTVVLGDARKALTDYNDLPF